MYDRRYDPEHIEGCLNQLALGLTKLTDSDPAYCLIEAFGYAYLQVLKKKKQKKKKVVKSVRKRS